MIDSKTSAINILIALEKEALQQVIDSQLPVDFLQRFTPPDQDDLFISVRRKGKLDLQVAQNSFKYQVPLELFVEKNMLLGNVDVLFEMYLGFETQFIFKDNWQLATRTQLTGYQWIKAPKLDFGLFDIPLDSLVTKAIDSNKLSIAKQIDAKISETLDFPKMLQQGLAVLPNPIPTPAENIWWNGTAIHTVMTPLFEKRGTIYTKIGLRGATEFSYGQPLEKQNLEIFAPDIVSDLKKESEVKSIIRLEFKAVEKTALELLQKQNFEFKGRRATVSAVRISQEGDLLKVAADLEGSFDGTMTLKGKPTFDNDLQEIKLKEMDLDLHGNNFLSKTLVVFLKGIIEEKLEELVHFPIKKPIDFLNQETENVRFKNGFFAKGEITSVNIPKVEVQEKALVIHLFLEGVLQLGLKRNEV